MPDIAFSARTAYFTIMGIQTGLSTVPEHSVAFMRAMSGGEALERDGFLFFAAEDWLIAVGYPLRGPYSPERFSRALATAVAERRAADCWAIAPELPSDIAPYRTETDVYYVLDAASPVPKRLVRPVAKAASLLRIDETKDFTAAHRKLWAEFLRRRELKPQVRELFARTPSVLHAPGTDLRLLNAWNADSSLAACLVMDYALADCSAYIIGAHSRTVYTPHAGDALFAAMLESARREGKRYIHLGLGVNEGITRFKKKWGGVPALPYQAASWRAAPAAARAPETRNNARTVETLAALLLRPSEGGSSAFSKAALPEQRPYAMLWELRKNGKISWIGGTAHSFRYSFASTFRKLFKKADTVLFEGPLDAASLAAFGRHGQTRDADTPRLIDHLSEKEVQHLERVVRGPQGKLAEFLNTAWRSPADVRRILTEHRPWSVFFTLYYAFLERHGWNKSVDLEAWEVARDMGRNVISMESLDEQIAALESVPLDRIIRFLQHPETWKQRMKQSLAAYLAGDLTAMLGTSTEFPTRTEFVIGARDERFRQRMRPYIEQGGTVVFVGTAHMLNLENMLREDGFSVSKVLPTWRHKLRAKWRG